MTAAERALFNRIQQRASALDPELAAAILKAFARIRDSMSEADIVKALQLGGTDRLFQEILSQAVMDVAFQPVRDRTRTQYLNAVKYAAREIPKVTGQVGFAFDFLNPAVIQAIRQLETKVITDLQSDVRQTVTLAAEDGLARGVNPREVAQTIKSVVGLGPKQWEQVSNFRQALEAVGSPDGRNPLDYAARDKRLDPLIKRLQAAGEPLSPERIDKAVTAYTKKRVALNAETVARTTALDAQKAGQRTSWDTAADQGIVDRSRLRKRWIGIMDDRERPEHVAMEGEEAAFDEPYSNGEMIPGESTYNCRCLSRYFQAPA